MTKKGLFVGLVTIDLVYLTTDLPKSNEKVVAADAIVTAGGPATNAAIAFSYLGDRATLLGVLGQHPIAQIVERDLENYGVEIADLDPSRTEPPPISSIVVTETTGDRAVISINATKSQVLGNLLPLEQWQNFDIVLIDGHQMLVSEIIAEVSRSHQIPIAIDGGSWKPGFEKILPFVDYAVCSANFYPPNCHNRPEAFAYLSEMEIPHIAITDGENPIQFLSNGKSGCIEVPQTKAIDTLGAGDIFHGAFCHYILQQDFPTALGSAAQIASRACEFFGTRQWMISN